MVILTISARLRAMPAALVLGVLIAGTSPVLGQSRKEALDQGKAESSVAREAQPPTLLFLAWQKGGWKATGQSVPHTVWNLKGNVLEQSKANALLKGVQSFDVAWRNKSQLQPLSLVFQVDRQLTHSPIKPILITADGKRCSGMTARVAPRNGLIVSAAVPLKSELAAWPKKIALEVAYPVENVTLVKTFREIPEQPILIASGVRWYLDDSRAREDDARNRKLVRALDKTAWVLELQTDRPDQLTEYGVRIFKRGSGKPVDSLYSTIVEREGERFVIRVSEAFAPEEVDRVDIARQRFKVKRFDDVPLRIDLLREEDGP